MEQDMAASGLGSLLLIRKSGKGWLYTVLLVLIKPSYCWLRIFQRGAVCSIQLSVLPSCPQTYLYPYFLPPHCHPHSYGSPSNRLVRHSGSLNKGRMSLGLFYCLLLLFICHGNFKCPDLLSETNSKQWKKIHLSSQDVCDPVSSLS